MNTRSFATRFVVGHAHPRLKASQSQIDSADPAGFPNQLPRTCDNEHQQPAKPRGPPDKLAEYVP
jgi:hypothetical protein